MQKYDKVKFLSSSRANNNERRYRNSKIPESVPSGDSLKPPQIIASKHLNGVPPVQIKFSAAPLEDQSDHLFVC